MSDDKYKNIPILEDIVQPDGSTDKPAKAGSSDKSQTAITAAPKNKTKRDTGDRRQIDRRKKQAAIPEEKTERRTTQRRDSARRSDDKYVKETLDQLAEKIMQDMMPDLEQHLFMQLRFELQKYVPQILKEYKDKDEE